MTSQVSNDFGAWHYFMFVLNSFSKKVTRKFCANGSAVTVDRTGRFSSLVHQTLILKNIKFVPDAFGTRTDPCINIAIKSMGPRKMESQAPTLYIFLNKIFSLNVFSVNLSTGNHTHAQQSITQTPIPIPTPPDTNTGLLTHIIHKITL